MSRHVATAVLLTMFFSIVVGGQDGSGVKNATPQPRRALKDRKRLEMVNEKQHAEEQLTCDAIGKCCLARQSLDEGVEYLISIARNDNRSAEDRVTAIRALAEVETQTSLAFLIRHIDLQLRLRLILGDEDRLKERPCSYALTEKMSWKAVQAVFKSLDDERSDRQLEELANALYGNLQPRRRAIGVVDVEIGSTRSEIQLKNLKAIRLHLIRSE